MTTRLDAAILALSAGTVMPCLALAETIVVSNWANYMPPTSSNGSRPKPVSIRSCESRICRFRRRIGRGAGQQAGRPGREHDHGGLLCAI